MSGRKIKGSDNIENLCPVSRKRSTTRSVNFLNSKSASSESASSPSVLTNELLEEMGIGLLESEESSSSAMSGLALAVSSSNTSDDTSNEATPHMTVPKFEHQRVPFITTPSADVTLDDITENYNNNTISPESDSDYDGKNQELQNQCQKVSTEKLQRHHKKVTSVNVDSNSNSPTSQKRTRNPLATVTSNNVQHQQLNQLNQTQIQLQTNSSSQLSYIPSTSKQAMLLRTQQIVKMPSRPPKVVCIPRESFFLYRTPVMSAHIADGSNHFYKLSDEIILHIFQYLPKKALLRIGTVSRRFNRCARDESLWTRLDLSSRKCSPGALEQIVSRGVMVLRLAQSEISEPAFTGSISFTDYDIKLQYLDLSLATVSTASLKTLFHHCRQLKKLSLEHIEINHEVCVELAKSKNLEALNLAMCSGIEARSVRLLMESLTNLNSLNISWTSLSGDAISALVTHVTPNLMRLNTSGCRRTLFDSHVSALVKRCPQLIELDLSDCSSVTSNVISILCKFKMLEYLSVSRCYQIPISALVELKNLSTLTYLDVFGMLTDQAMELLEKNLPKMGINKFVHSSVARPTVGSRRTSIWGVRTRD